MHNNFAEWAYVLNLYCKIGLEQGATFATTRSKTATWWFSSHCLFVVFISSEESYTMKKCRINWGRSLILTLRAQSRSLKTSTKKEYTSGASSSIYCMASNKKTASGLAQEKAWNLIITYTGTLIESTCYYNRAQEETWKGKAKFFRQVCGVHSPAVQLLVCSATISVWTTGEESQNWADQVMFLNIKWRI